MLYVTKAKIALQVSLQGGKVSISPAPDPQHDSKLLSTIASNEELLAQIDLRTAAAADSEQQLIHYFTQRGWTVSESAPQVSLPGEPAGFSTRSGEREW